MMCWSPKGGSGTSTVATGLAIAAARRESSQRTLIVDAAGDIPAILGVDDPTIGISEWLSQPSAFSPSDVFVDGPGGITLFPRGTSPLPEALSGAWSRLEHELAALSDVGWTIIVDAGRDVDAASFGSSSIRSFVVVRPCYLALRRARSILQRSADQAHPDPRRPASGHRAAVVVAEADRVLTPADVESVLGIPVRAVVPVHADVSRRVDAGIIATRPPSRLIGILDPLLDKDVAS